MTIEMMVDELVGRDVIAEDTRGIAKSSFVRELERRTRRTSYLLVLIAERQQLVGGSNLQDAGGFNPGKVS